MFPKWDIEPGPPVGKRVWTTAALCPYLKYPGNRNCMLPQPGDPHTGSDTVIIVDHLDSTLLEFAAMGATVLVVSSGPGSLGPLPTLQEHFHPSWWTGNAESSTDGTVVYDGFNKIAPGMAPEGWCDQGWFQLLDQSTVVMLDAIVGAAEILIRAVDLFATGQSAPTPQDSNIRALSREKAVL